MNSESYESDSDEQNQITIDTDFNNDDDAPPMGGAVATNPETTPGNSASLSPVGATSPVGV